MLDDAQAFNIVTTIIELAHSLGLQIVAEGIETLEQKDRLQELGCQIGQGYLLSKPLNIDKANKLIQSSKVEGILCP